MGNIPALFADKESCCGCSACAAICPVNAIAMSLDEDGFFYPCIDEKLCVRCLKCLSVCVFEKQHGGTV